MPICLNLLAEQQAAEEARRRDPVKRALWAGSALVALMFLWMASLQLRIASARAELSRRESKLQSLEEDSKEAHTHWAANHKLSSRLTNLQRYSTNRFFSATLLDALQQVVLDDVRVVQLQTVHTYTTNAEVTFKTNVVVPVTSHPAWQFWRSSPPQANILSVVSNQISAVSNKFDTLKGSVPLITKIDLTTNATQVSASLQLTKPTVAIEDIVLIVKARDYSNPPGKRVDEFSKGIAAHPYFAQRLRRGEGEGIRLRERAIQPEFDTTDPISPMKPFVPFVIECRYRQSVRANE